MGPRNLCFRSPPGNSDVCLCLSYFQPVCPPFSRFLKINFIYLFLAVGSSLLRTGFSLVAASGGYSSLCCAGFPLRWLLSLRSTGSRPVGFSSCGTQAQSLWRTGLVALWHVGSSRTRDRTRVPCIRRRILNHSATREVPVSHFLMGTEMRDGVRSWAQ